MLQADTRRKQSWTSTYAYIYISLSLPPAKVLAKKLRKGDGRQFPLHWLLFKKESVCVYKNVTCNPHSSPTSLTTNSLVNAIPASLKWSKSLSTSACRLEVHHGSPSWYRCPSCRWTQDVTKLSVGVFLRGWSGAPLSFFLWLKEQPGQSLGTAHRHNTSKKKKENCETFMRLASSCWASARAIRGYRSCETNCLCYALQRPKPE